MGQRRKVSGKRTVAGFAELTRATSARIECFPEYDDHAERTLTGGSRAGSDGNAEIAGATPRGEERLEAAREIDAARISGDAVREHLCVDRPGAESGRAGHRAEGRTEACATGVEVAQRVAATTRRQCEQGESGADESQRSASAEYAVEAARGWPSDEQSDAV